MKKIFTLIAAALLAVGAQAQSIAFTETIAKGSVSSFGSDGFVLTVNDPGKKMEVDANDQYFGTADEYAQYNFRLKTGGKSDSKQNMSLSIPSKGTLKVAVRTASSSATDRNLTLNQGGETLYDAVVKENEASDYYTATISDKDTKVFKYVSVAVEEGTVDIGFPVGALIFYAFELVADTTPTAIESVKAENNAKAQEMYNLAGQQVDKNYKGVVVMNGKKFINK